MSGLEKKTPIISVITPVYNCEKYLEDCILSVVSQSSSGWELILVDDGSTDRSGDICDRYIDDSRIQVIHQSNMGELMARMNGVAHAKGDYILGLDADDLLARCCIDTLTKTIEKSGADLIWFNLQLFGGRNEIVKCSLEADCCYSQKEIICEVVTHTNHSMCNKAIKWELFDCEAYNSIAKNVRFNLDYAQIIPILCKANSGYVIDETLYQYRIHEESISHHSKVKQIFDTGEVTEFVLGILKKNHMNVNDLESMIWNSYLKMVGDRLVEMLVYQTITKEECKKIHDTEVYQKSKKYEKLNNMSFSRYVSLKLFRYKQYGVWKIIAMFERRKLGE